MEIQTIGNLQMNFTLKLLKVKLKIFKITVQVQFHAPIVFVLFIGEGVVSFPIFFKLKILWIISSILV
jgi:hypothetical protein